MGLAQVAVSFFQHFSDEPFYVFSANRNKLSGITGFFGHYNPLAAFCNVTLLMMMPVLFFVKLRLFWRVSLLVIVVSLICSVWHSGSRGGWLGLVAGLGLGSLALWWGLYSEKHPRAFLAGIVAVMGLVLGLSTSFAVLAHKTEVRMEGSQNAAAGVVEGDIRTPFQGVAFDIFMESPVVGQGARAFSYRVIEDWDLDRLPYYIPDPKFVHNEYWEVLASYGIVGLFFVLIGLGIHGAKTIIDVTGHPVDFSSQLEKALKIGSFGAMAALAAQSYFSFLMHFPSLVGLAALVLGVQARKGDGGFGEPSLLGIRGLVLTGVTVAALFVGQRGIKSDLWARKANYLAVQEGDASVCRGVVNALWNSADSLKSHSEYEIAGQAAMGYALEASRVGDVLLADECRKKAKDSFNKALVLNPYSQIAICGLPRVLDSQGEFEKADRYHERAISMLSPKEYFLSVNFYAARSSFLRAYGYLTAGELDETRHFLRQAKMRVLGHLAMMPLRPTPEGDRKKLIEQVVFWNDLLDAENLYRAGHETWIKRDPERGLALMREAEVRYERASSILEGRESVWNLQRDTLVKHIAQIEAGNVIPAQISEEEVAEIAAGLVSAASNR